MHLEASDQKGVKRMLKSDQISRMVSLDVNQEVLPAVRPVPMDARWEKVVRLSYRDF